MAKKMDWARAARQHKQAQDHHDGLPEPSSVEPIVGQTHLKPKPLRHLTKAEIEAIEARLNQKP